MRISRPTPLSRIVLTISGALAAMMLGVPGATAQSAEDVCADALLTVSPDSIDGEHTAVAITSQQLDADVDGWTQVSWAATEGTTLTAVTVHRNDGNSTLSEDIDTGTVEDALALTFCGTLAAQESDDDADEQDGTAEVAATCDNILATVTPTSVDGDETAIAITSQQLDADVDGWTQVSWQAADATTLTGVTVRTSAGTSTRTEGIASGTAENVLELTFCGTVASDADDGEASDDEIVEVPAPSTPPDDGGSDADPAAGGTDTGQDADDAGAGDDADTQDGASDPGDDEADEEDGGADAGGADDGEPESDAGDTGEATQTQADAADDTSDDTEVLGVQLTQDEDEGSGWLLPVLMIVAVAGAVGAGILVRNRYLDNTGGL